LRVRGVLEGVEDLLQGDDVLVLLVDGLPHDAVRLSYVRCCFRGKREGRA